MDGFSIQSSAPPTTSERGAILIIASFALMGVLIITGLVFDFGLWFVTKGQLQAIADTTALAGGRVLGAIYAGAQYDDDGDPNTGLLDLPRKLFANQQTYLQNSADHTLLSGVVDSFSSLHRAGSTMISIKPEDVVVGRWDYASRIFTPGSVGTTVRPNAVQVTVWRATGNNSPLAAIFGRIWGVNDFTLNATAVAALTPLNLVPPNNPPIPITAGQLEFPLAIDADYNFCPDPTPPCQASGGPPFCIVLDQDDPPNPVIHPQAINTCTASHTFSLDPSAWDGIINHTITSPQTAVGDIYNFRGNGRADYEDLSDLWVNHLPFTTPVVPWRETLLAVYQGNNCNPVSGPRPIVGFVSAMVIGSADPAVKYFWISFACNVVGTGRSGGQGAQDFGTFGSVPVLVQ